jgi:hypothetical protein
MGQGKRRGRAGNGIEGSMDEEPAGRTDTQHDAKRKKAKQPRSDRKAAKKRATARVERIHRIGQAAALLGLGAVVGAVAGSVAFRAEQR